MKRKMEDIHTNVTPTQALTMLTKAEMRAFDEGDWAAFAGCESEKPMIGEYKAGDVFSFTLIVDGNALLVIAEGDQYGGQVFNLVGEKS